MANQMAVKQLDKIEHDYPVVRKSPNELWMASKDYYEHSRLKTNFDKISGTKKYYQDALSHKLDTLLDFSDSLVDKYVAVHSEANGQPPQCDANGTYFKRVQCISGKAYFGVKHQAGEKYEATKQYALQMLGDLHLAMFLIEYAKNTGAWANEKAHTTLTMAQQQAKALWHDIQRRAEPITGKSEMIVLHLVQGLAANVAALSQQVAKLSTPYLPEGIEKNVAASAAYATELRDTFAKAKTLGDLRDEVVSEAKRKLVVVQAGLTKGIDYLIEVPPTSWLITARAKSEHAVDGSTKEKTENGYADARDYHDGH